MAAQAFDSSLDIDRDTGADIVGWPHVVQCMGDFFTTPFGERIMREWYGSLVPRLLGENMTDRTIVRFFSAIVTAIEQWEPRYRVTKVTPLRVGRDGGFAVRLEGQFRPRALLGDFTSEGPRHVTISQQGRSPVVVT